MWRAKSCDKGDKRYSRYFSGASVIERLVKCLCGPFKNSRSSELVDFGPFFFSLHFVKVDASVKGNR